MSDNYITYAWVYLIYAALDLTTLNSRTKPVWHQRPFLMSVISTEITYRQYSKGLDKHDKTTQMHYLFTVMGRNGLPCPTDYTAV